MDWEEEEKSIKAMKRTLYRPPLPVKPQRCRHYRGRSGKVKVYSEEEILRYQLSKVPDRSIFERS